MRPCWLIGLALCCGGCGISAYEDRMQQAKKTLDRLDEESRYLDNPARGPEKPNKEGRRYGIANVFLRLPRGFSSGPANDDSPRGICHT